MVKKEMLSRSPPNKRANKDQGKALCMLTGPFFKI